ncbi:MAG: hypothetical protein ACPLRP_07035, partial [Candidatus Bipolaricaulaceae bacterium]
MREGAGRVQAGWPWREQMEYNFGWVFAVFGQVKRVSRTGRAKKVRGGSRKLVAEMFSHLWMPWEVKILWIEGTRYEYPLKDIIPKQA